MENLLECQSIFSTNQSSPSQPLGLLTRAIQLRVCVHRKHLLLSTTRANWRRISPSSAFSLRKINGSIARATICSKSRPVTRLIIAQNQSRWKKVMPVNFSNSSTSTRHGSFRSIRSVFWFFTQRMWQGTKRRAKWSENCQRCSLSRTSRSLTRTSSPFSSWASSRIKPYNRCPKSHFACLKFLDPSKWTTQSNHWLMARPNHLRRQSTMKARYKNKSSRQRPTSQITQRSQVALRITKRTKLSKPRICPTLLGTRWTLGWHNRAPPAFLRCPTQPTQTTRTINHQLAEATQPCMQILRRRRPRWAGRINT